MQLAFFFGLFEQFVCCAVCLKPDQDAYPLNFLQGWVEFVKATDKEISHQAVEVPHTVAKQDPKAVTQGLTGFVSYECQVGGHLRSLTFLRRSLLFYP